MNEQQVAELVREILTAEPQGIERLMLSHSGNVIYDVALPKGHIIARMQENADFTQTAHNIAALSRLGLPVPRVLAVDATKTRFPFAYILLEKIPGRDLLFELSAMTGPQMTRLAEQMADIQRAVGTLPEGSGFGWGHIGGGGGETSWFAVFGSKEDRTDARSDGTIVGDLQIRIDRQSSRFQSYFRSIRPTCFLEDLTTKNVLLRDGELQGLIDFDCVCFGDPLWMIGLTAGCIASEVGIRELFYIEELCRLFALTEKQRLIVALYAAGRAMNFLDASLAAGDQAQTTRILASINQWLMTLE